VGKGGRTFVEVFHIGEHAGGDPVRGRRLVVELIPQTLQNHPQPARLECRTPAVSSRIRHARPFRVRARDADAYRFGVTPSVMMCFRKNFRSAAAESLRSCSNSHHLRTTAHGGDPKILTRDTGMGHPHQVSGYFIRSFL